MYPNQDAIFERLETTKKFGLLSDYLVSWTGRSGRLSAITMRSSLPGPSRSSPIFPTPARLKCHPEPDRLTAPHSIG